MRGTPRDWPTIVKLGIDMKAQNPRLNKSQFYRIAGFTTKSQMVQAEHAIGKKLALEWQKLSAGALEIIQRQAQRKLAETVKDALTTAEYLEQVALANFKQEPSKDIKDLKDLRKALKFKPRNFEENMMLWRMANSVKLNSVRILAGKKPLAEDTDKDFEVAFHRRKRGQQEK